MESVKITMPRIVFDLFLILIFPYAGVYMDNHWVPPRPGFRCNDPTLSYPKRDNTISPTRVTLISGCLPLVVFLLYDLIIYQRKWTQIYQNIISYIVGINLVFVTNNLVKYNLGWPRPYYIQACDPDYSNIDCSKGYILNPPCLGDALEIKWASLTFPSLHASTSAYGMTYLIIFLNQTYSKRSMSLTVNLCSTIFQCFAITWYVFVSVSRVNDHRHHIRDVIAGSVWGFVFALMTLFRCSGLYIKAKELPQEEDRSSASLTSGIKRD